MGNVVSALELAQRHQENLPGQQNVLMLLWIIHEMDAFRDYSMAHYLRRGQEAYTGDRNRMMREMAGEPLEDMLERWAKEIRAFLDAQEENDGGTQ